MKKIKKMARLLYLLLQLIGAYVLLNKKDQDNVKKGVTEIFDSTTTTGYLLMGIFSIAGHFGIKLLQDPETLKGVLWIMIITMVIGVIYVTQSIKVVVRYAKKPGALGVSVAGALGTWWNHIGMSAKNGLGADGPVTNDITSGTVTDQILGYFIKADQAGLHIALSVLCSSIIIFLVMRLVPKGFTFFAKKLFWFGTAWSAFLLIIGLIGIYYAPEVLDPIDGLRCAIKVIKAQPIVGLIVLFGSIAVIWSGKEAFVTASIHTGERPMLIVYFGWVVIPAMINFMGQIAFMYYLAVNGTLIEKMILVSNNSFFLIPMHLGNSIYIIANSFYLFASISTILCLALIISNVEREAISANYAPSQAIDLPEYRDDTHGPNRDDIVLKKLIWLMTAVSILMNIVFGIMAYLRTCHLQEQEKSTVNMVMLAVAAEAAYGFIVFKTMTETLIVFSRFLWKDNKKTLSIILGTIGLIVFIAMVGCLPKFLEGGFVSVIFWAFWTYISYKYWKGTINHTKKMLQKAKDFIVRFFMLSYNNAPNVVFLKETLTAMHIDATSQCNDTLEFVRVNVKWEEENAEVYNEHYTTEEIETHLFDKENFLTTINREYSIKVYTVGFLKADTFYESINLYLNTKKSVYYFETQYLKRSFESQEYHFIKERLSPGIRDRFKINDNIELIPLILVV